MNPITLPQATAYFLSDRQGQNCSPETILYYRYRLLAFGRHLQQQGCSEELASLTPMILRTFLAEQTARCSASTAKHSFITLRAFFRFLQDEGLVESNPLATLKAPRVPQKLVQTFTPEQIASLFGTCDASFVGVRDRAIMLVLIDSGLRVSELCTLTLPDIRWEDQTLKLMGKGAKERRVPFGMNTKRALQGYLMRRGTLETQSAFVTSLGEPLLRRRVEEIILARGKRAKLTGVRCSPHTFRHTCAVCYLRQGGDVFSLQKLLGHADLTMTRRYAELAQTDVITKHRQCSPGDFVAPQTPQARRRIR